MHVLITRPDPGPTAARWRAAGARVTVAPLLAIAARGWEPPTMPVDALAFTSVNGVTFAGPSATQYAALPVFAVGGATARAAVTGWSEVHDGGGTAAALFDRIAAARIRTVLHLAGVNRVTLTPPPELIIIVREVYVAMLVALSAKAMLALAAGQIDAVPLSSPRLAAHFAAELDRTGVARAGIALAALSPAVAAAAGTGWRRVAVAVAPTSDALFAATLDLCDKAWPIEDDDGAVRTA